MAGDTRDAVSQILDNPGDGAVDELVPLIYDELRRMARRQLAGEGPGHTLNTTALAHEAYLKLAGASEVSKRGRSYFFGAVARNMRQILIDHARRRRREKRGGDRQRVTLDTDRHEAAGVDELIELNEALEKLAAVAPRQAQVVEYRYFGGMSIDETAGLLGVSPRTVKNDWTYARSWLYRSMKGQVSK